MSEKLPTTDIETADAPVTEKGTFAGEKLPESDTPAYVRTPRARSEKAEAAEEFGDEIACDYCDEVIKSLCDYADGLTSTKEETACARKLRDELSHYATTRMEAFRTPPYAGRNCCALIAVAYFFAAFFYFMSFFGDRVAGIVLVLISLGILIGGGTAAAFAFLGDERALKVLYPRKVSYNVFSENKPFREQQGNKLLLIASNHDAAPGSYFMNFDFVRKVVMIVAPVSVLLFILFCLIKLGVGSDTVSKITSLTVLPFLTIVAGIFALLVHFSPFQKHARENNGAATAVSMAIYRHLLAHPEKLPEGTRVCFVSFGGENSAHAGSRAFAAAHPEIKGAKALVLGDIESSSFALIRRDALRNKEFSHTSASALFSAVEATGVPCSLPPTDGTKAKLNALHGYAANALADAGCECAVFCAKDYTASEKGVSKEDAGKLYSLALQTILEMAGEKERDE